jgi:hypothetical protein
MTGLRKIALACLAVSAAAFIAGHCGCEIRTVHPIAVPVPIADPMPGYACGMTDCRIVPPLYAGFAQ